MKLIPYLIFQGNTEEVMNTYQKIFNGTLHDISRFGDGNFPIPEEQKNRIMHARLTFGENMLMLSDCRPDDTVIPGNCVHLSIGLKDEVVARSVFDQLAVDGKVEMPMEKQFWGALYGQVVDKFGINWMINCDL